MKLSHFFQFVTTVTVLSLIYVNMQMQIFDLAYLGKARQQKIVVLNEKNRMLTYDTLKLKSVNNLGNIFLAKNSPLQFHGNGDVVHLVTTQSLAPAPASLARARKKNSLLSFLSFRSDAEANAAEVNPGFLKAWQRPQ